jgi:single-strand DNA-binding protein
MPPRRQPSATGAGAAAPRRIVMFNEAQLIVTGYVANEPEYSLVGNGIPKLTMRVAWTTRRREPSTGEWVDGNTSFVRVTCWRRLADNLATCLRKGDPVLLRGRLDVRPFTGKDGVRRVSVDVDANSLGHDLSRGVAGFRRVWETTGKTAEEAAAAENGAGGEGSGDREAALAVVASGGPVPGAADGAVDGLLNGAADGPADEEIFDDSAIEALAQDTGSVTAPS